METMETCSNEGFGHVVSLPTSARRINVPLVAPRSEEEGRLVVSSRQTDRMEADDLVSLACQLANARDLVKGRACDRLRDIARQMEHLQMAAREILQDAQRDEDLHQVPCNMAKQPGRIYHLYSKNGQRFFSLIAPHEWGQPEKLEQYSGSYRLEFDRSWTPIDEVEKRDTDVERIQHLMRRGGPAMLTFVDVLILDNGAYSLKIGTSTDEYPRLIPNSIVKAKHEKKRVFVADEFSECVEKTALFYVRPIERGYVVNWDTQQKIWERAFASMSLETQNKRLVLTDNNYLVPALSDVANELLFEVFEFDAVHKTSASSLVAEHSSRVLNERCVLVVDCGFSFTHVAPFVDGLLIQEAVVRLDVGGKALTNKLKDWISYRQLNVMEETHVINECKEDVCFVSQDFDRDMVFARKKAMDNFLIKRYVLPDFETRHRGVVTDIREGAEPNSQSITLNVERFALPEILFNPSDIGVDQIGVAEAVVHSIQSCPENLRPALAENVVVMGGSSKFPGFTERLRKEIRSFLNADYDLKVVEGVPDAETHAWRCARELFEEKTLDTLPWVSRLDWLEHGESLEYSRFFRTLRTSDELRELMLRERENAADVVLDISTSNISEPTDLSSL
ncbi:unnamed protein product [Caenorhabditis auriculariae]|uniref:Actin-related protein 6 n=1 Tax=Caenorhabditis auriculariae TaxID=2777116 RepID=A0A8S1HDR5_9PELO|nr:unnamed protein product [Caenorhabditis auriculariae]